VHPAEGGVIGGHAPLHRADITLSARAVVR
jgi:hypothetical protein